MRIESKPAWDYDEEIKLVPKSQHLGEKGASEHFGEEAAANMGVTNPNTCSPGQRSEMQQGGNNGGKVN